MAENFVFLRASRRSFQKSAVTSAKRNEVSRLAFFGSFFHEKRNRGPGAGPLAAPAGAEFPCRPSALRRARNPLCLLPRRKAVEQLPTTAPGTEATPAAKPAAKPHRPARRPDFPRSQAFPRESLYPKTHGKTKTISILKCSEYRLFILRLPPPQWRGRFHGAGFPGRERA